MPIAKILPDLLTQLSEICDTGYALAIHIRFTRPSLLYQTYSQEWNEYYSQNGLMLYDPVVRWGLENTGLVRWDALLEDDPHQVLAKSREFGLRNGVTFAVGPASSRTISGFTRSGDPFDEEDLDVLSGLVDDIHSLTEGIEDLSEEEVAKLREIDLSEY